MAPPHVCHAQCVKTFKSPISWYYQVLAGCSSVPVCGWRVELTRKWCSQGCTGRYLLNEPGRQNMCLTGWVDNFSKPSYPFLTRVYFLPEVYPENANISLDVEVPHHYNIFSESVGSVVFIYVHFGYSMKSPWSARITIMYCTCIQLQVVDRKMRIDYE